MTVRFHNRRYIGYKDILLNSINFKAETLLKLRDETDAQTLGEVFVVAKKNLEGERALQMERQKATLAIENLGAKEMSIKGISNVEEGVKKITSISIASAGQLIVRGLGDRCQHHHSERTSPSPLLIRTIN